ncbi:MAG TPA: AI-2E family transporter [Terriglobales bacterium]|jgi:predicted PurR-regulated permease PerM|nr:AI-2E family transporter [Terriglobales bacterium]
MGQPITNVAESRPGPQAVDAKLPPPEVAVAKQRPHSKGWSLTVLALGAVFAICYFAEEILVVLLISILIAFVLAPVADFFARLHLARSVAAAMAVCLLLAVLASITYYGVNQASNLVEELPKYADRIRQDIAQLSRKTQKLEVLNPSTDKTTIRVQQTQSFTDLLSRGFGSLTEALLAASFIPFLAFFMLTWQEHARNATVALFPLEYRRDAHTALGQIAGMVRSFMVGNLLIAMIVGSVSTVVFGLLHVPFFYFAGFVSGFLSLVPYLGVILAILPPLFLGIGHLSVAEAGWIFLTVVASHLIAMNVLYPKILGKRLQLNPLAVTIALLTWAWLWGALGLLLAVPLTAGMKIIFDHVESLKPIGAWLGEESPQNGNGKS